MSPHNPQPKAPPRTPRARNLPARLLLLLCATLAIAEGSSPLGRTQTPAQAQPSPTPYVRPRKVAPKADAGVQPAQPPSTQTQSATPQPAPPQPAPPARPADDATAPPAAGQDSEVVDEDEVVRVDSNLVIIPASVVDARGRAVTDLKVDDFELKVDGEVKPIRELTRAETPVHVALLFDNSASLSAAREFEKQAAVRFFKSVVRPIDRAAVYSISTVPTLAQGLTNDVPRLVRTIEHFGKPDGATALFDTVAQAADYMRPLVGRKVLVVVSDGTDTVSDVDFDEAVNRALRAECQVYVVQTRQVEDPNLHDPVSEQRMYRISEQTGGAVFVPQSVEELDAVFTQISLDLSQQYLLSYYPQEERKDKYFRFISVRVKTRPSLRVRARKGFYPGSALASQNAQAGPAPQPKGTGANVSAPAGEAAAALRRTAASSAPPPERAANSSGRARPGPDGPDTEEPARPVRKADETTPTFTLTASAPAPVAAAPKPSNSSSLFHSAPERAGAGEAVETSAPAGQAAANRSPESAAAPKPLTNSDTSSAPASAAREEARGEKAAAGVEGGKSPVSGGVLNGKALRLPVPIYPAAARNYGASGSVVVEVTVDEQGKVIDARAVNGHPFLQQAAVHAARQARFTPAKLSGEPVKVKGTINYVFTLP